MGTRGNAYAVPSRDDPTDRCLPSVPISRTYSASLYVDVRQTVSVPKSAVNPFGDTGIKLRQAIMSANRIRSCPFVPREQSDYPNVICVEHLSTLTYCFIATRRALCSILVFPSLISQGTLFLLTRSYLKFFNMAPSTGSGERARRRKISLACEPCRVRKSRCDGGKPICATCQRRSLPLSRCIYTIEQNARSASNDEQVVAIALTYAAHTVF